MCGILGGFSARPFELLADAPRLRLAIDLMTHRGPDDRGQYVAPDRRAFLGFRRLSIIDLAGGHQPIADEGDRTHFCFNGEIYNFRELRVELESRGHVFRTRSDGETALHLYQEDPRAFVGRLRGMFALAIHDQAAGRLTLARDRNGIKPLFYFHHGDALIFASELKSILALLPERPAISPHALRQYLRWKYVPDPLTIYRDVYKLPPGWMLTATVNADALQVERHAYWSPDFSRSDLVDESEALDALDRELRAAVACHLEADVELGALLSGGVDSSLVTALATLISGRRIKTFSVGFDESGFDQLPFARKLAEAHGTEHHEEHVRLDPLEASATLARHFDEPFADSSALACYRVCQVAARHVKTVLTGDGGDESFAGYKRFEEVLAGDAETGRARRMLTRAAVSAASALLSPEAKFLKNARAGMHPPLVQHEERQVLFSRWLTDRLLGPEFRDAGEASGCVDPFHEHRHAAQRRGWSAVQVAQYVDLRMYLPGDILTKVDRTSMACSLECRVPLLDHHITEFSARLDVGLKIRGGVRKYLLKKLAERYVPPELLYRPKMGFRVPIRRWFKRDLLPRTAELLRDGALARRGVVNSRGVEWMLRQQRLPWIDMASQLWALLCAEHWARAYL